jgi:hypothetical protein
VSPPSHLTYCTPTKYNFYFDSSFDTVTSEPVTQYISCTKFPVHIYSLRFFIQRIRPCSRLVWMVHNMLNFYGEGVCLPHLQTPSWRTTPCRLSAAAYSVYSQLPSIAVSRTSIRNPRTRHAVVTRGHKTVRTYMTLHLWWIGRYTNRLRSEHPGGRFWKPIGARLFSLRRTDRLRAHSASYPMGPMVGAFLRGR